MIIDDENHEDVRNPIVAIMGHVDHGKTTLLDTICQTNVQEKERGGITQKITVSQIIFEKKKIIFLDTPGHEDFIYIRSHSALLADIIILVISASDGLMKQTLEVIEYLKKTELPCIVFINKKMGIEIDNNTLIKIKSQLQKKGIFSSE